MKILEDYTSLELAKPKAFYVLSNLHEVQTFEHLYSARPPLAAYNISLTTIARRLIAVIKAIPLVPEVLSPGVHETEQPYETLLEATDHLLDALMEHMDVCNGILRSFYHSNDDIKFKKKLAEFKAEVQPYRKHIGTIVNYIKHSQGKLRAIRFQWQDGCCFGYFVEGPLADGALGPVGCVHSGENTAFSFNRDIPYHVCSIFGVGARLASALYSIDKRLVTTLPQVRSNRDLDWSKALEMTAQLPNIYFHDELHKGVPMVKLSNGHVQIAYPANRVRLSSPPLHSKIGLIFSGDGVTRSYKMPYYQN